ncbi:hypothetical protein SAMN04487915_111167 [Arthrobacter sp. ov118]|nr:hypothetical protein SAMN04487915_111167 [Arthrobacter sp. ov118]
MKSSSADTVTVRILIRSEMDPRLEQAVDALSGRARERRCGILVTRTGPSTFTASLGQDIPYGTTREATTW